MMLEETHSVGLLVCRLGKTELLQIGLSESFKAAASFHFEPGTRINCFLRTSVPSTGLQSSHWWTLWICSLAHSCIHSLHCQLVTKLGHPRRHQAFLADRPHYMSGWTAYRAESNYWQPAWMSLSMHSDAPLPLSCSTLNIPSYSILAAAIEITSSFGSLQRPSDWAKAAGRFATAGGRRINF